MTDAARSLIQRAMADAQDLREFSAYAPSNIALSKYWGKRDQVRNLPLNSSLSISLAEWGSHTTIRPAQVDRVTLNGEDADQGFSRKALAFADLFRGEGGAALHIDTRNTIPTASGLASSASGFAALTKALCGAYGLTLSERDQSLIARLGSGSASRSIWHGFVRWNKGEAEDGSDSHGVPLDHHWPEFRIAIVKVDTAPKTHSSRDGMNHTTRTSPLFPPWPAQAEVDCAAIEQALIARDFTALGERAEANALAMHATMQAARPSLTYLSAQSWKVLDELWRARSDGLKAYATMDAGPNIKLIYLAQEQDDLLKVFPEATPINPFETAV